MNEVIEEFLRSESEEVKLEKSEPKQTSDDPVKMFFVIPYISKASERFQRKVSREMKQHYIDLKPAYRTIKVEQYMCLKTAIPTLFKTNFVYKFQCPYDKDVHYIGETERQFFERILDHVTCSTGVTTTAVCEHIIKCNGCAANNNIADCFSVLRSCNRASILSEEALCIIKHRPSLNVQVAFKGARTATCIFN